MNKIAALDQAASNGDLKRVKCLLGEGVSAKETFYTNRSPLFFALIHEHYDVAEAIIAEGDLDKKAISSVVCQCAGAHFPHLRVFAMRHDVDISTCHQ